MITTTTPDESAAVLADIRIQHILHGQLHPSPTNPRKTFEEGPLHELSLSIEERGIKQPLLARPSKTHPGGYEIVAGERRWRSNGEVLERAGAQDNEALYHARLHLPVIVEDYSDTEVLELQLIENLQRRDLTPLEEADAYRSMLALRDDAGVALYTPDKIAEKLGRSAQDVYRALKWGRLPELARLALEKGVIGKEHATQLGRIPGLYAARVAALMVVFYGDEYCSYELDQPSELEEAEKECLKRLQEEPGGIQCMSVVAMRDYIRQDHMVPLSGVKFDLADPDLAPEVRDEEAGHLLYGGPCTTCPARTGCNPVFAAEIAGDEEERAKGRGVQRGRMDSNICTQPDCYRLKIRTFAQREVLKVKETGVPMMPEEKSRKLFSGSRLWSNSGYVDLAEKPGFDLLGHVNEGKAKPWEKLLKGTAAPHVAALDEHGQVHYLVERDVAVAAVNLKAMNEGKESPFLRATQSKDRPVELGRSVVDAGQEGGDLLGMVEAQRKQQKALEDAARMKDQREKKIQKLGTLHALRMISDAATTKPLGLDGHALLFDLLLENAGVDALRVLATLLDVTPEKAEYGGRMYTKGIRSHLEVMSPTALQWEGYCMLLACANSVHYSQLESRQLVRVCQQYGVSITEAKLRAKDELKPKKDKKARENLSESRSQSVKRNEQAYDAGPEGLAKGAKRKATDEEIIASVQAGLAEGGEDDDDDASDAPKGEIVFNEKREVEETLSLISGGEDWTAKYSSPGASVPTVWGYYCDTCHGICHVAAREFDQVASLEDGAFRCSTCDPASEYLLLAPKFSEAYETWEAEEGK